MADAARGHRPRRRSARSRHARAVEETGVPNAVYLGETDWLTYDFPPYGGPPHRLSVFRGQRQKWFALRFEGRDEDINVASPPDGHRPEFDQWRWERLDRVADLVVPFRREVYRQVAKEFARFAELEADSG